jgi:hypothetical protein
MFLFAILNFLFARVCSRLSKIKSISLHAAEFLSAIISGGTPTEPQFLIETNAQGMRPLCAAEKLEQEKQVVYYFSLMRIRVCGVFLDAH